MKEWTDQYNPFNSIKILMWREWLEGCAKNNFLPPITVDVDPSGRCNLNCVWCNFMDYNKNNATDIPKEHLLSIADFVSKWGVQSVHVLGGGEPLMNPGTGAFFERLKELQIPNSLITNGILLKDNLIDIVANSCRWVGISLDAGTQKTYKKVKDTQNDFYFSMVLKNIEDLTRKIQQAQSNCSVCVKYLLHPFNTQDIFKATKLAKELGADAIHIRPAGWENISNKNVTPFEFTSVLDEIEEQMEQARLLEDASFKVYGIRHKFQPSMERKINYKQCIASPIVLIFGADGNCHICGDRRGQEEFILCSHYPDVENVLNFWNSKTHKQMIKNVNLKECPRCVLGTYHEIIEKVIIKDSMCRHFP